MVMKKVSLLLILIFATITVSAQERGVSAEAGRKATFAREGFWDNWFIGAGAGANMYFGGTDQHAPFFDRFTVVPTVQIGKWYNPYLGARVKFEAGKIHTFSNDAARMNKFNHYHGHVDVMFDVTNYLGRYNENRFYSFIPFAGVGFAYANKYRLGNDVDGYTRTFTLNGGFINKFRLSNRLDLDIEVAAYTVRDRFDMREGGNWAYDINGNVSASLVYKIGKAIDFKEATLMDQGLIDDLNDQINKLRAENARLAQRPERCEKCPDPVKPTTIVAPSKAAVTNVVFFRLGSATIDKGQQISIFNTAKYLQDNPSAKVKVTGYADKKTGTASINEKLSEKRAKNVANTLINKYNINSNRVTVEWKGDREQPYAENAWNRVAIFIVE